MQVKTEHWEWRLCAVERCRKWEMFTGPKLNLKVSTFCWRAESCGLSMLHQRTINDASPMIGENIVASDNYVSHLRTAGLLAVTPVWLQKTSAAKPNLFHAWCFSEDIKRHRCFTCTSTMDKLCLYGYRSSHNGCGWRRSVERWGQGGKEELKIEAWKSVWLSKTQGSMVESG